MAEQQLKLLHTKRGQIKAKTTRFKTYLNEIDISKDLSQLKVRMNKFQDIYNEFESVQNDIELIESDTDKNYNIEREQFENLYFELFSKAESLRSIDTQFIPDANINPRPTQSNISVKLPTIQLPSFDGKYEEWSAFQELFNSLIHDDSSLSDTQKFHYLKTSLHGTASSVIASLEVTSANYQTAWSLLKDRFENKRIIVNKHIAAIHNLTKVEKESGLMLRSLLDTVNKHLRALESLGQPVQSWDALLIFNLTKKLDSTTLRLWESHIMSSNMPTFAEFTSFLQSRCQILESIDLSHSQSKPQGSNTNSIQKINNFRKQPTSLLASSSIACPSCNGNHKIYQCSNFKDLQVQERILNVKKLGLCLNCLSKSHQIKDCQARNCKICSKKHNTLLHIEFQNTSQNKPKAETIESTQSSSTTLASQANSQEILLSTAVVHVEDAYGNQHDCRVLLDSASQSNFITDSMASRLRLEKNSTSSHISGIGKSQTNIVHSVVTTIHSRCTSYKATLSCLVISHITNELPHVEIKTSEWNLPPTLQLADLQFNTPGPIDMLIGAELFFNLLSIGQFRPHKNAPIFQKTSLGWVASGKVNVGHKRNEFSHCHFAIDERNSFNLQRFWDIEECESTQNYHTKEELQCEKLYTSTTSRDSTGRYTVDLPTRENVNQLGDSYDIAKGRLLQIERKLAKNPQLKQSYVKFMKEYEDLGHMEQIESSETPQLKYYIPHLPVIKDDRTTTKTRVVFDASVKTTSGLALNDTLMVGPTIQRDLFSILCRFRTHNFVLTADIEKMYRQILVNPFQTDLQRILWREHPSEPIKTYRLKTVTYGTSSAPFLAIRTLHQLAMDEQDTFPEVSPIVINDFYVDDLMTGCKDEINLKTIQTQISTLMTKAGFHICKWSSNSPSVLSQIPIEDRNPKDTSSTDECTKVLGMLWNSKHDSFHYIAQAPDMNGKITKRIVLSEIASLFDPLGLLGPVILKAKIFIQKLWQLKVTWDESLPEDLHSSWQAYRQQIQSLKNIKINRHVMLKQADKIEVHGFCDASEKAYGACVYIRTTSGNSTSVRLLCSKSRVAPLSKQTIPRLELCGAVLLSKLINKVLSLNIEIDTCSLWSDSSIVLTWIQSPHTVLKQFVSNRVKEIQILTQNCTWNHVRTIHNPADIISRGVNPIQIIDCSLWWNGPSWLADSPDTWPISEVNTNIELLEQRKPAVTLASTILKPFIQISDFSSLTRLQRVTAYCLRFIYNIQNHSQKWSGPLQVEELQKAMTFIIKCDQQEHMRDEIHSLRTHKEIHRNSPLLSLHPFIDSDGVIRVGGRLKNSTLSENQKYPVLLAAKSHLSGLIARHEHMKHLHSPPQLLLSIIRQQYWPIRGKDLVRKVVHNCVRCFRANPRSTQPIMGNLPANRVKCIRPFTNTGTDLCGPVYIKASRRRNSQLSKGYIVVFVCFSTKAIHLELVSGLTTEAYLAAFRRFISRRGVCENIYSDNGTNFVGANRELKELKDLFISQNHKEKVTNEGSIRGIKWHFIPPRTPHFGGLWEAGIRSVKHHLRRVVGNASLTFEEFYTTLTMIEACLNSRPLTSLSNDPNDLAPLTPGHFLIGNALTTIPEPELTSIPHNRLSNWQRLQQITQHFWSRWSREYLSSLQHRPKWKSNSTTIQLNQLVIIKDDNLPPLKWITGRIIHVHPGTDNQVRVVTVKTATGIFKRAVNKVCILPIEPASESCE